MNKLAHPSCNNAMSSKQYFTVVAVITFILLLFYVFSKPVLTYQISEKIGLSQTIQVSNDAFYHQRVQPIFDKYCSACHDDNKAKGHLRLDTFLQARYSGKSGHNIVPLDVEQSLIIARMMLDENDKRLMPPLGWDRLTEDDMTVLKLWIEKGASPVLAQDSFPSAPLLVVDVTIPKVNYDKVKQDRQPVNQQLSELTDKFPHAFSFIASNSHYLRFTNVSLQKELTDNSFASLLTIAPYIASLYLRDSEITEQSSAILLAMNNIHDAYLDGVNITETTLLTFIEQQKNLQRITVNTALLTEQVKTICLSRKIELNGVPLNG